MKGKLFGVRYRRYPVTSRKYSQYFGFTQEEMADMLDTFGASDKMEQIRTW